MVISVTWQEIKTTVDAKGLSVQWVELLNKYIIIAIDSTLSLKTEIEKDASDTTDLDDFEANYKAIGNQQLKSINVRQLGQDNITKNPRTMFVEVSGTPVDKKLISTTGLLAIRGGWLWIALADWDFKDTLSIRVIDKDNVLGLGGTPANPTLVIEFIPKDSGGKGEWGIAPNMWNELIDESITSSLPNGLYLRVEYIKNGGTNTPKAIVNLDSYEV